MDSQETSLEVTQVSNQHLDAQEISNHIDDISLGSADSKTTQQHLLPREAWQSQIAYLKAVLKAKKILDLTYSE